MSQVTKLDEYASAKRDARIVELRATRTPFREIAAELKISHQRVHQLWNDILERIPASHLDRHRQEAAELADDATRRLLTICDDPTANNGTKIRALEVLVKWQERLARLRGDDAPVRRELEVHDSSGWEHQLRASIEEDARADRAAKAITIGCTVIENDDDGT